MQERSKRYEAELFGQNPDALIGSNYWTSQRSSDGMAIINAKTSRDQGVNLNGVTIFTFDNAGHFKQRIEARAAVLEPGVWELRDARINELGVLPVDHPRVPAQDQPDAGTGP